MRGRKSSFNGIDLNIDRLLYPIISQINYWLIKIIQIFNQPIKKHSHFKLNGYAFLLKTNN